jgi:hypothetical protein
MITAAPLYPAAPTAPKSKNPEWHWTVAKLDEASNTWQRVEEQVFTSETGAKAWIKKQTDGAQYEARHVGDGITEPEA